MFAAHSPRHRLWVVPGLAAAAIVLVSACSSGSGSSALPGARSVTAAAPVATTSAPPTAPVTVAVGSSPAGPIVVDANGHTLYRFDMDTVGSGASACNGACAAAWPPALIAGMPTGAPGLVGALGTITRSDGTVQVALDGHPLYRFSGDQNPGDTTGDGFGGIWHVVSAGGASPSARTSPATAPAVSGY